MIANSYVGGFTGEIDTNSNISMTISNSVNNGNVNGSLYIGGFVGCIYSNTKMTMTISNSTNNGYITEDKYVGGLVGFIHSAQLNSISLFIINSDNRGSVSSKSSMACGMICVDPEGDQDVKINIKNSINKGVSVQEQMHMGSQPSSQKQEMW